MFLHASFGLITAVLAHRLFGADTSWWLLCGVGVAAAFFPDLDVLRGRDKAGRVAAHSGNVKDHRHGLHYPTLTTLSIFLIVAVAVYSYTYVSSAGVANWPLVWFWAMFVAVNVILHFVIDSFGVGWGIRWLYVPHWSATHNNYKFFCDKQNRLSWQFLVSWTPEELKEAIKLYGDKDWLGKYLGSTGFLVEWIFFILTGAFTLIYFISAPH